jgi:hypothetical protein
VELESNPARLGKGTSRLWDLILLGRDGMETETETRRLVLLANHAALDGDSICLWLAQILAALPRHAKATHAEVSQPSISPFRPSPGTALPALTVNACFCLLRLALVRREARCRPRLRRLCRLGRPWMSSCGRAWTFAAWS